MLIDAGFSVESADTAADVATPPARRVRREMRNGKTVYVYRDPELCHCIYVGGAPEYEELQRRLTTGRRALGTCSVSRPRGSGP